MKYKKNPIIIEAFQWMVDKVPDWWIEPSKKFRINVITGSIIIPTLEGDHEAKVNDFIVKGTKGELYPVKPDIFLETYTKL